MRLLDKILCAALFCVAVRIIFFDLDEARGLHGTGVNMISFDVPDALRSISGFDENGKPVSALPSQFRELIFFVIHGQRFNGDIDFWDAVGSDRVTSGAAGLVGICDGSECLTRFANSSSKLHFVFIGSGNYLAMKSLLQADQQNQIIVLDQWTGNVRKLGYPKSAGELTNALAVKE